jgi:hypothetical protein
MAKPLRAAMLLAAACTGICAIAIDPLLAFLATSGLEVRLFVSASVCAAIALTLGLPFPSAIRAVAGRQESVPWAFGVNGFASVAAPALAIIVSAEFGLNATFLAAAVLYAVISFLPEQT